MTKKVLTSAIQGMSIADMRKYLILIRSKFFDETTIFNSNDVLYGTKTIWQFSCDVVYGLHTKRATTSRRLQDNEKEEHC